MTSWRSTRSTPIDLLIVNLYPFEETTATPDCTIDDAIENIDIGGPAMLRAAAKNHEHVVAIVDPADYAPLLEALSTTAARRSSFADGSPQKYSRTPHTTTASIANWLGARDGASKSDQFPPTLHLDSRCKSVLRYGENPHQNGGALFG